jgi:hypothetical protein
MAEGDQTSVRPMAGRDDPDDPVAKEVMPDQPIVGFGDTEHEARFDAVDAFTRSLTKVSDEDKARIGLMEVEEGATLLASSCRTGDVTDETESPPWAKELFADPIEPGEAAPQGSDDQ